MTRWREACVVFSNKLVFMGLCKIPFKTCSCKTCSCGVSLQPLGASQRGRGRSSNSHLGTLFQCPHPPQTFKCRTRGTWFLCSNRGKYRIGILYANSPPWVIHTICLMQWTLTEQLIWEQNLSFNSKLNPAASWQDSVALLSCFLRQKKGGRVERGLHLPPTNLGNATSMCFMKRKQI